MKDPEYSIIMAPGEREIYEGKYDDVCSVADFLSHMPVASASALLRQEVFHKEFYGRKRHVFWYSSAEAVNNVNPTSKSSASGRSVQELIMYFLEERFWTYDEDVMVQFWIPKRSSSGRTVLTVSEQPFAMDGIYKGLCWYRYRCIQQEIDASSDDVGPIGRVFNGRSSELCENIDSYSIQDFPMRDYAKYCGIKQYAAAPISKSDDNQKCIGVMELLIMTDGSGGSAKWFSRMLNSLEAYTGLTCTPPHAWECKPVRSYQHGSDTYQNMMESVRSKHGIPLIQIWAPCLCHTATRGTQLFCHGDLSSFCDEYFLAYGAHSVKNGKGLVGRAYSQTKCCFFEDMSRLRMSDNPLVHNTRSFNLTACFAIPLQSINPNLHPLILEVFLPPQQNYDHGNLEALLNSILATVFEQLLLRSGEVFGMTADEELSVKFSNSDDENFVYFSVERVSRTATLSLSLSLTHTHTHQISKIGSNMFGDERSFDSGSASISIEQSLSLSLSLSLAHTHISLAFSRISGSASLKTISNNGDVEINSEMVKSNQVQPAISVPGDDETEKCRSLTVSTAMGNGEMDKRNNIIVVKEPVTNGDNVIILEDTPAEAEEQDKQGFCMTVKATYMNDTALFRWGTASWGIKELCRELEKRFEVEVGGFYIKYKDGDGDWIVLSCDEDLRFHVDTLKASKQSTLKLEICTRHQVEITSDKITQEISTGRQLTFENITQLRQENITQNAAAKKLGVSPSTLKRRCKELGFERWPNSKRKNGHCLPSSARVLKKTKGQCWNGDVIENEDREIARDKSAAAMGNDEFDRENDNIAVLATYEGDTVPPFRLCCNSGIEQLRKEVDDSFQIEGDKYKIKYKQEDGRWITLLSDTHLRFRIQTLRDAGQSTMELSVFPDSL